MPHLRQVPIVALTAHAMIGDEERILAAGFDGYLSKPVNLPSLVQDIEQAMAKKARRVDRYNNSAFVENTPENSTPAQDKAIDRPIDDFSVKEIPQ